MPTAAPPSRRETTDHCTRNRYCVLTLARRLDASTRHPPHHHRVAGKSGLICAAAHSEVWDLWVPPPSRRGDEVSQPSAVLDGTLDASNALKPHGLCQALKSSHSSRPAYCVSVGPAGKHRAQPALVLPALLPLSGPGPVLRETLLQIPIRRADALLQSKRRSSRTGRATAHHVRSLRPVT